MVSHFLNAEVSPEIMEVKIYPGFGTQKTCSFLSNRGVPLTDVTDTKIIWTFSRDQIFCALSWGVLWIEMPQRRCSTVFALLSNFKANYWSVILSKKTLFLKLIILMRIYNSNRTEWSPIRSDIRVINNAGVRFVQSCRREWLQTKLDVKSFVQLIIT